METLCWRRRSQPPVFPRKSQSFLCSRQTGQQRLLSTRRQRACSRGQSGWLHMGPSSVQRHGHAEAPGANCSPMANTKPLSSMQPLPR
ncbi:hypothetical protein EYF80_036760 [Liparis tanakae]|uniref:Uncharacterized protein n=1 Tax=Liparis tanakae TaxID=230148 RepID=A0A4Z2GHN4_9TELE|nr:hypothetical protein EYF80_036760 [Liparis tanakae]